MTSSDVEALLGSFRSARAPAADTPGGLALLGAVILGVAYLLVLVGDYSALSAQALWVVTLNLILSVVVTFFLVSMITSDRARATEFELDFARTVQAHLAAGETLVEASPLGGILTEYARVAKEQRQLAREHAYAASPAVYSTAFALLATLVVGLALVMGGIPNVIGFGMVVELGALAFLALAAGSLVFSVGRRSEVAGYDILVLRRWSKAARPSFPFTHSLGEVPWVVDAVRDVPSAPWIEGARPSVSAP